MITWATLMWFDMLWAQSSCCIRCGVVVPSGLAMMFGSDKVFDSLSLEEGHIASITNDLVGLSLDDPCNFQAESSATTGPITPLIQESLSPPGKLSASLPACPKPVRRLMTKSSWSPEKSAYVASCLSAPSSEPVTTIELAEPTMEWWEMLDRKGKYNWIYYRISKEGFQEFLLHHSSANGKGCLHFPNEFKALTDEQRRLVAKHWCLQGGGERVPQFIKKWVDQNFCTGLQIQFWLGLEPNDPSKRVRSKRFMFSCNGDLGLLTLPESLSPPADLSNLIPILLNMSYVAKLWGSVQAVATRWHECLGSSNYTMCLEVCCKTWNKERKVRLHAHIAFESEDRMSLTPLGLKQRCLGFPFKLISEQSVGQQCPSWFSFYNVQAPKIGHLYHTGTKLAHEDFAVPFDWVWNLVQSKMMYEEVGRTELVKSSTCLTRHLSNLDRLVQESVALDKKAEISRQAKILEHTKFPFKQIAEVTALVQDLKECRERRKFLVLDGLSCMGKTMFVMSLFGRDKTLEVNCAGQQDPALQEFRNTTHRCILFDEADPEMVIKYRNLFQAPNTIVQMGESLSPRYPYYSVYANECLLVICSTGWSKRLARMRPSHKTWLQASQVLITVTEPLFLPSEPKQDSSSSGASRPED